MVRLSPHPRPTRSAEQPNPRAKESRSSDDDDIKWFEKNMATGEVTRVAGNPEELEAAELREKIKKLEEELKGYASEEMNEYGVTPSMLKLLEPHEKAAMERAMKEERETRNAVTEGLNIPLEPSLMMLPMIKGLNNCLRGAVLQPGNIARRKELWRSYVRAKRNMPSLPSMLPTRAWQVLWDTMEIQDFTNPDRDQHPVSYTHLTLPTKRIV